MIIYLHDTPYQMGRQVAANRNNIDTVGSINNFLRKNSDVILSADDGYRSVKNLVPLLEKYNIKLLFFVTTGFIDKSVYPYEVLISNFLEQNCICKYGSKSILLNTLEEKECLFKSLHQKLKPLSLSKRQSFVNNFFSENKTNKEAYKIDVFMNWDEVQSIAKHPLVEIGSHSISHIFLPKQSLSNIFYELKESKRKLEEKLDINIRKISYPYGGNNLIVKKLAKLAGYKEAYGTHYRSSKTMNQSRIALKDLL